MVNERTNSQGLPEFRLLACMVCIKRLCTPTIRSAAFPPTNPDAGRSTHLEANLSAPQRLAIQIQQEASSRASAVADGRASATRRERPRRRGADRHLAHTHSGGRAAGRGMSYRIRGALRSRRRVTLRCVAGGRRRGWTSGDNSRCARRVRPVEGISGRRWRIRGLTGDVTCEEMPTLSPFVPHRR